MNDRSATPAHPRPAMAAPSKAQLLNEVYSLLKKRYKLEPRSERLSVLEAVVYGICHEGPTREQAEQALNSIPRPVLRLERGASVSSIEEIRDVLAGQADAEERANPGSACFLSASFSRRPTASRSRACPRSRSRSRSRPCTNTRRCTAITSSPPSCSRPSAAMPSPSTARSSAGSRGSASSRMARISRRSGAYSNARCRRTGAPSSWTSWRNSDPRHVRGRGPRLSPLRPEEDLPDRPGQAPLRQGRGQGRRQGCREGSQDEGRNPAPREVGPREGPGREGPRRQDRDEGRPRDEGPGLQEGNAQVGPDDPEAPARLRAASSTKSSKATKGPFAPIEVNRDELRNPASSAATPHARPRIRVGSLRQRSRTPLKEGSCVRESGRARIAIGFMAPEGPTYVDLRGRWVPAEAVDPVSAIGQACSS